MALINMGYKTAEELGLVGKSLIIVGGPHKASKTPSEITHQDSSTKPEDPQESTQPLTGEPMTTEQEDLPKLSVLGLLLSLGTIPYDDSPKEQDKT